MLEKIMKWIKDFFDFPLIFIADFIVGLWMAIIITNYRGPTEMKLLIGIFGVTCLNFCWVIRKLDRILGEN